MKKKLISVFVIMTLLLGTYNVALAEEVTPSNATRNSLKSIGKVVYTDGQNTVAIDSDDLYMLADKIDSFKKSISDQLAQLHTYFSNGNIGTSTVTDSNIKVVHTEPSADNVIDPVTLDLNTLLEGIAASQNIPSNVTEYGYADGTLLYKTSDGKLTTDSTLNDVQQIDITPATSENLSAGSAAWVNGELILGTGADNSAYYNLGFTDGYAQKASSNASISYIYHTHNSSCNPRNCTVERTVGGIISYENGVYVRMITTRHYSCGAGTTIEYGSGTEGTTTYTHTYYSCGKSQGQLEGATITYN